MMFIVDIERKQAEEKSTLTMVWTKQGHERREGRGKHGTWEEEGWGGVGRGELGKWPASALLC